MSDTVIRVENLGKRYVIGHQQQEKYTALRDVLANKAKGITNIFNPKFKIQNPNLEEFWALKDVSFEVKRGDRVGIIGRNGAGKSTLLKILSRITEPTTGRISIKGRVASLLEVGTGFHPELTGRENIYLNGAILGMGKVEIRRKFDEIVAFAEVEKFLDTPVKRYSSGMYVRLAFAVAAHLDPEILIVDEVLAVGDVQFQKKCLGKMEDVGKEGRTVIFVSHNVGTINQLCTTAYLLQKGCILKNGNTQEVIAEYLNAGINTCSRVNLPFNRNLDGQYLEIRTVNSSLTQTSEFSCDDAIRLEFIYEIRKKINGLYLAFYIENSEAVKIIFTDSKEARLKIEDLPTGDHKFCIDIPRRILAPDSYYVTIGSASSLEQLDLHQKILSFNVYETSENRSKRPSVLSLQLDWQCQSL